MFTRSIFALVLMMLATPAMAEDIETFQSPSGNIHCASGVDEKGVWLDCELVEITTDTLKIPRPADCDLDWGQRYAMSDTAGPEMVCHGDTVRGPDNPVLDYGRAWSNGGIMCVSTSAGLECRNPDGHGFLLSKAKQRFF